MPIMICTLNGVRGWKFGQSGKCYTGRHAKAKAISQALAIGEGKMPNEDSICNDGIETRMIFKEQLGVQKRLKKIKKVKKPKKWLFPMQIERQYIQFVRKLMKEYKLVITNSILPRLSLWTSESKGLDSNGSIINSIVSKKLQERTDQWQSELENEIANLKDQHKKIFDEKDNTVITELLIIAVALSEFNAKQYDMVVKSSVGINVANIEPWLSNDISAWANNNYTLLESLGTDTIKEVNRIVSEGVRNGKTSQLISNELKNAIDKLTKTRATLIARDQIGKLNGDLTKKRQKQIGIDTYWWITSRDERVRATHAILHGKLCRWDDPTVYSDDNGKTWKQRSSIGAYIGDPGQDVQCRCFPEANFEPIFLGG